MLVCNHLKFFLFSWEIPGSLLTLSVLLVALQHHAKAEDKPSQQIWVNKLTQICWKSLKEKSEKAGRNKKEKPPKQINSLKAEQVISGTAWPNYLLIAPQTLGMERNHSQALRRRSTLCCLMNSYCSLPALFLPTVLACSQCLKTGCSIKFTGRCGCTHSGCK